MQCEQAAEAIRQRLFALRDDEYAAFSAALTPNVERARFIGVRTPQLRRLARELDAAPEKQAFLAALPHYYQEENCLHGYIIERIKDEAALYAALDAFLPHVTNWAVCDTVSPPLFKKRPSSLLNKVDEWLAWPHIYAKRFALRVLMAYYLDDANASAVLQRAAAIREEDYYIKMMVAWLFATALAKQYARALPYIEAAALDEWTHNKAIQKALESRRITAERKAYLRTLKRK